MPATIKYDYRVDTCGECHQRKVKGYSYHFCSLACMVTYVAAGSNGLPCLSCHATGLAHGFKENGTCRECGGRGKVPQEIAQVFNELAGKAGK
jgi:hypothetical protein